jgi:Zn-dependent protease with chaperone function
MVGQHMTLPVEGYQLTDISPKAYEHPADAAATAALASVPMLDAVVRKLIEFGYERALRQSYLGASVRLGPNQLPDVYRIYEQVLVTLDMPDVYPLYVTQDPVMNAMTIGADQPIIVLRSSLVNTGDEELLRTVLAHEVAHILSEHVLYRTALMILLRMTVARMPMVAGLPLMAARAALLEWARATELSCDRAAALVARDPMPVCRSLMLLTGGVKDLDLDAYLAQASEYNEGGKGVDRLQRLWMELGVTHALPVKRVREVMDWVRAGDFDRIVAGDYVRRGDDVDVRKHADAAVQFYADRFQGAFKDAGDSIANAGEQFSDWVRKASGSARQPGDEDDGSAE